MGAKRAVWIAAAIGAVGGIALLLITAPHGLAISPDSVTYLRAGDDLAHLRAPTQVAGDPLDLWPPLYPAALAVLIAATPFEPTTAARILAALLMPITAAMTAALAGRLGASARWSIAAGALALVGAGFIVATSALSEQLFGVFVLATLLALASDRVEGAGLLAGLSVLTRTIGVVLVGAAALALWTTGRPRRAAVFTGMAAVLPAAWVVRNLIAFGEVMPTVPGSRAIGSNLSDVVQGIGQMIAPTPGPDAVDVATGLAGLAIIVVLGVRAWARPETRPVGLFVLLFPVALVVAESRVGLDPISNRLLAPMWAPLVVLAAVELSRRTVPRWTLDVAAIGLILFAVYAGDRIVDLARDGVGYPSAEWDGSALIAAVDDLPDDTVVISNQPWALAYRSGRPITQAHRGQRHDPDDAEIVVAWFRDPSRTGALTPTDREAVEDETGYKLEAPTEVDDGVLYEVTG